MVLGERTHQRRIFAKHVAVVELVDEIVCRDSGVGEEGCGLVVSEYDEQCQPSIQLLQDKTAWLRR